MRLALVALLVPSIAIAEDWDGTYQHRSRSGNELCPDTSAPVVVSAGKFSIVWNIRARGGDLLVPVGRIEGSVRDNGFAEFKARLLDPLPKTAAEELRQMDDKVEDLQALASSMSLRFSSRGERVLGISSGMCSAAWQASAAPASENAEPTKAKPAKKPAKPFKAPPPLATGAAKWDATYNAAGSLFGDWRCPDDQQFKRVVIKKGRFAIPWQVKSEYGDFVLGQVDGSIGADGKVKLRTSTIDELPDELAAGGKRTIADVRAFAATMTFTREKRGRKAELAFGEKCTYDFLASDYKLPQVVQGGDPRPKITNGHPCVFNSDCASNKCDWKKCVSGDRSKPNLGAGAECVRDSDCASRNCTVDDVCK